MRKKEKYQSYFQVHESKYRDWGKQSEAGGHANIERQLAHAERSCR